MHCPYCKNEDTKVLDSRVADDGGSIRRRRTCAACDRRFTTVEKMQLTVLKRSGATEPFNRDKAIAGVRKACKGRPVTDAQLACLGQEVEDALRLSGQAEFDANDVGLAILAPLRGGLPPLRERLPRVRVGRRLRRRDQDAAARASRRRSARASGAHGLTPRRPGR
jgi:transcriptional repressor NrdR